MVHQHLPAQGLRGFDYTPSKQRHPRSAAPPRRRECQQRRRHSGLLRSSKSRYTWVTKNPHSPGSAPCDFFLIPQTKQQLKGKRFQGVEDAPALFEGGVSDMPQSMWSGAMVTRFERMFKCEHADGVILNNRTRGQIPCHQISTSRNLWGDPRMNAASRPTRSSELWT